MGRNRLVMIIDENPEARAEMAAMLKGAPVAVVADCGYGVEAGALAEETTPDLIIAAIEQPMARALQTLRAVRSLLPETPIVAHSETSDMNVVRQIMQIGVTDMLPRPLQQQELLSAVRAAIVDQEEEGETPSVPLPAGTVLTVVGAKGGVGKSTLTANVGAAIARDTHHSVLVMDMDTRFGDIAIMLDIEPRFTVADLASSVSELDRQTFRSALIRHDSGVYVLPAPRHPNQWRNVSAEQVTDLIRFAARLFDYVILDTPGTFNDVIAAAIQSATQVLVVTSKDLASIKDTAYLLELLAADDYPEERLYLLLNDSNHNKLISTADVESVLHRPITWELPYDARVLGSTQAGQPVLVTDPKSKVSRQIAQVALDITGPDARRTPEAGGGFFSRIFSGKPRESAAAA